MIAFVTNIFSHYRKGAFSALSSRVNVDFFFFSEGKEWYWQTEHGLSSGSLKTIYLPGFRIGNTRITPTLPWKVSNPRYRAIIKCINGKFALPITFVAAKLSRKPFILWTGIWMRLNSSFHRLFFPLTRYIYRHADAIAVYGTHVREYLVSEGVKPDRIFLVPNSVDNDHYSRKIPERDIRELKQSLSISDRSKVLIFMGRLVPEKGLPVLLNAFASIDHDNVYLVIAGSGPMEKELKQQARYLGLDNHVRFPGYIPVEETIRYYASADLLVLPSITTALFKEPWGLVVNEAMNQGIPVIASDAVGAAAGGLVQDGKNGLVVPEGDEDALAAAIVEILGNDERRESMSAHARTQVKAWNHEVMADGFLEALRYVGALCSTLE